MNRLVPTLNAAKTGKRRFKLLNRVYDRWWPWNIGRVVRTKPLRVKWSDGTSWIYDRAHQQFLEKV